MTIRKRGSKWNVQVRVKGIEPVSRTFDTKAEASRFKMEETLRLKSLIGKANVSLKGHLLSDLFKEYMEAEGHKFKINGYKLSLFTRLFPHIDTPIDKLTVEHFRAFRELRLKTITKETYHTQMAAVASALRFGVQRKGFSPEILQLIDANRLPFKPNRRTIRILDMEEKAMTDAAHRILKPDNLLNPERFLAVKDFLVETGMRRGEALSIDKSQLDLKKHLVILPQTKNGKPRLIPLTDRAEKAVQTWEPIAARGDGLIFPVHPVSFYKAFKAVCAEAGLENKRPHDFRHEALSRMAERGLSPSELMFMSGHSNLQQLGGYIHANFTQVQQRLRMEQDSKLHQVSTVG